MLLNFFSVVQNLDDFRSDQVQHFIQQILIENVAVQVCDSILLMFKIRCKNIVDEDKKVFGSCV